MKSPVLLTYKILKEKAFNSDLDESWIEWAIEMIDAGYESINLYELAGTTKPYNQFQLKDLTDKVFKDLNLDYSDKTTALKNYVYFLLISNIDKPEKYHEVLGEFRNIYYELNTDAKFQDLALLYWAKDDLLHSDFQHYWNGANRTNIDQIIRDQFELYIEKFAEKK
ncbi:MAG: hypothetical protein JST58_03695 [Bacteroidetes bacterium]|nr:hypothetical protein [Bacteroidota bacterium]